MKKLTKTIALIALASLLILTLSSCGSAQDTTTVSSQPVVADVFSAQSEPEALPTVESHAVQAEPEILPDTGNDSFQSEPEAAPAAESTSGRQDGERFQDVIMLEGMEETVSYEHVKNDTIGIELDYDYENFVRQSDGERERFVSDWDDPANPENYLEVSYDTGNANLVADAISATLSQEYDLSSDERELDNGVNCVRIEASVVKGTNQMADLLQEIYIIPAGSGSIVARACYAIEGAEGFGRRFAYMVRSLNVLERKVEGEPVEDELALSIIRNYCLSENPDLQEIVDAGEYPVSWEIESSDGQQVVILFRSYTGALVRYYIDRATGDTYVTEFVPGITAQEQRTGESFKLWDQVG